MACPSLNDIINIAGVVAGITVLLLGLNFFRLSPASYRRYAIVMGVIVTGFTAIRGSIYELQNLHTLNLATTAAMLLPFNTWAFGLGCGLLLSWRGKISTGGKSEQIQTQWQNQDAKLVAEIKSDREKQLEAKIATLETALKSALQKKS